MAKATKKATKKAAKKTPAKKAVSKSVHYAGQDFPKPSTKKREKTIIGGYLASLPNKAKKATKKGTAKKAAKKGKK